MMKKVKRCGIAMGMTSRFIRKIAHGIGALALSLTAVVSAQTYPNQPITLILPYPPGGSADFLARPMLAELQKKLGQTVIIDYKAGAGGTIATSALARSKPDGYTILMVLAAHAINDSLYPSLPYDTRKDFAPVSLVARLPLLLVTRPTLNINSVSELIAYAKANPGKLSYGSAGNGNTSHLAAEMFQTATGTKMEHIPYKGSGPVVVALLGGEIDLTFDSFSTSYPHVPTGKFKALAVAGGKRAPLLPDVPTISETVPGFVIDGWYGILAPAATPKPIVDKLSQAFRDAANTPSAKAQLNASGYDVVGSTPEVFAKTIEDDLVVWGKVVKDSGAKVQ
jgi:tripartite-type tricarboxylate transporter receptor subunit TctC